MNVAIAVADGSRWFAVEHRIKDQTTGIATVGLWVSKSGGPSLEFPTNLQDKGMYPTIVTSPGNPNIIFTTKESGNQSPQLEVTTMNRTTLASWDTQDVVSGLNNPTFEHGRSDLALNPITGEQHLCWTRDDPADPLNDDDDLVAKVKDQSTWLASSLRTVSATADPVADDHCQYGFMHDGVPVIVHHFDATDEDIRLVYNYAGGSTSYTLENSNGVDFPALSIVRGSLLSTLWVIAKTAGNTLRTWHCDSVTSTTGCDANSEWSTNIPDFVPSNPSWGIHDPKLVSVGLTNNVVHRFALVQRQGDGTVSSRSEIHLLSLCHGATQWTDEGALPVPVLLGNDQYSTYAESMGPFDYPGSGMGNFIADGTTLRAVFIGQKGGAGPVWPRRDALEWSAASSLMCP